MHEYMIRWMAIDAYGKTFGLFMETIVAGSPERAIAKLKNSREYQVKVTEIALLKDIPLRILRIDEIDNYMRYLAQEGK